MASKYNIILGTKIDTAILEQQLKSLSGKYKIDLGGGTSTTSNQIQQAQVNVEKLSDSYGTLSKTITDKVKGSTTAYYSQLKDGVKITSQVDSNTGQLLKTTENFSEATKDGAKNTELLNQNLTSAISKFTA